MRTALLVLDVQSDYFFADNPNRSAFERAVSAINEAITCFRSNNWPVIFVQHTSRKKPVNSSSWELYDRLDILPGDLRMTKGCPNAFWQTDLEQQLQRLGVESVVIAGFVAENCVLSTLRGAAERGFRAMLLSEGTASLDDRRTEFVRDISPTISLDELMDRQEQHEDLTR